MGVEVEEPCTRVLGDAARVDGGAEKLGQGLDHLLVRFQSEPLDGWVYEVDVGARPKPTPPLGSLGGAASGGRIKPFTCN